MNDAVPSGGDLVALQVDTDVCVGIGQCEMLEPDVFEIDDDLGVAVVTDGAALVRDRAALVAARCPSGAISFLEHDGET